MATNISRYFKDISLSFARNPITNDLISLTNEDAIKKSVINLVRTQLGERFFNSLIGTSVNNSLFELQTAEVSIILDEEIKTVLKNFEPRIRLNSVNTTLFEDSNEINIQISYNIVGLPLPTQNIEFLLQPTRV
jgi:phage baseplate assembly protein W